MKIRGPGGPRNTFFKMAPMSHSRTCEIFFHPRIKIYVVYLSYIINNMDNNSEKNENM